MDRLTKSIFAGIIVVASYISAFSQADNEEDQAIVCPVELSPKFPGGVDSLKRFIAKNLITNKKTLHYEGKVFVEFVINENGSTSDFKVVKGLCDECDKRSLEVLQKMPKWTPGKSSTGQPIKCRFVVPVAFNYF